MFTIPIHRPRLLIRLIIILPLFVATKVLPQIRINWQTLEDVRFSDKYNDEIKADYYYPHFGSSVTALQGKEVFLKGYAIVISPQKGVYVLSRYPNASCFFCGKAGPESIVELNLKSKRLKLGMDQVVTIKGRLRLNRDDIYHCNYILERAELY